MAEKKKHKHCLHDVEFAEPDKLTRFCCLCADASLSRPGKVLIIELLPQTWQRGLNLLVSHGTVVWTKRTHRYQVAASAKKLLRAHGVKFRVLAWTKGRQSWIVPLSEKGKSKI